METTWQFPGRLAIDGRIEARRVGLFLGDRESALVTPAGAAPAGLRIYLRPFTRGMLRTSDVAKMKAGFALAVSGANVGACAQDFGHPADNESISWPLERFELHCRYTVDSLRARIHGTTLDGVRSGAFDAGSLAPRRFVVQFIVARADMRALFDLNDRGLVGHLGRMDACGEADSAADAGPDSGADSGADQALDVAGPRIARA